MKKTNKSANGTSFHNVAIKTTVNKLIEILGEPTYTGDPIEDKVQVEWVCENESGEVVTVYDWKEFRRIDHDEKIYFHIGGHNYLSTVDAKEELEYELTLLS